MKPPVDLQIGANDLAAALARNWWGLLLRGILAIAFALLTWFQPGISIAAMVLVFGFYTLIEGALGIWAALVARGRDRGSRWALLLWGVTSVLVGVLALAVPGVTALVLLYFIAAWACVTGVFQIMAALRLRKAIRNEWWLVFAGVLSVVFGILLFASPVSGALAVAWLIATYVFIVGVCLVLVSLRLRKLAP